MIDYRELRTRSENHYCSWCDLGDDMVTEIERLRGAYENTLSIDELRRELRYALDVQYGILNALRDLPQFPPPFVLVHLGTVGKYPEDWNRGKQLQREHGLEVVPPKTECEKGAGFWERIRNGLVAQDAPNGTA